MGADRDTGAIDIDQIMTTLQRRVAERRANGDYPPGLERQLEAEFEAIMRSVHRHEVGTEQLAALITGVERSVDAVDGAADSSSRIPGGGAVHATAARLVQRHTGRLADTVRALGTDIGSALHEIQRLLDQQRVADERQLRQVVHSLFDRIAVLDHLAETVLALEQRVSALEQVDAPAS